MHIEKRHRFITAWLTDLAPGTVIATYNRSMELCRCFHLNGAQTRKVRAGGILWSRAAKQSNRVRYLANR